MNPSVAVFALLSTGNQGVQQAIEFVYEADLNQDSTDPRIVRHPYIPDIIGSAIPVDNEAQRDKVLETCYICGSKKSLHE